MRRLLLLTVTSLTPFTAHAGSVIVTDGTNRTDSSVLQFQGCGVSSISGGANINCLTTAPQAFAIGPVVNVKNLVGISANRQISTCGATMASSSPTLTMGCAIFAAGDVGKDITIVGAGPSSATGQVLSIPVSSSGSYTVLPTGATVSGSPSTVLTATILGSIQAPSAPGSSGGTCTAGTYTVTLKSGTPFRPAQVNVTVNAGGTLTTINSVVDAGVYPSWGTPPLTGAVLQGLGSCTGTMSIASYGIAEALITLPGAGYPLTGGTASLTGGTASVAGTLGTPVVIPQQSTLASTIETYISPTTVVLDDGAATGITSSTGQVSWGNPDDSVIATAVTALCAQGGGTVYFPALANNLSYGVANQLPACTNSAQVVYEGAGYGSQIGALQYTPSMFYAGTGNTPERIYNLRIDGQGVVQNLINLYQGKEIDIKNNIIQNAASPGTYSNTTQGTFTWNATSDIIVGNPAFAGNTLETTIDASNRFENELYVAPASYPSCGMALYGTDNVFTGFRLVNVQTGICDTSNGNNHISHVHVFNYVSGYEDSAIYPTYCFSVKGSVWLDGNSCDGAATAAYDIEYAYQYGTTGTSIRVIGNRTQWGSLIAGGNIYGGPSSYGIQIASKVFGATIVGNGIVYPYSTSNGIFQIGTADPTTIVGMNTGASYAANYDTVWSSGTGSYCAQAGSLTVCSGNYGTAQGFDVQSTTSFSRIWGQRTRDQGVAGRNCFGYSDFSTQGDQQTCDQIYAVSTTGTTANSILTFGNQGSAGFANLFPAQNAQLIVMSGIWASVCQDNKQAGWQGNATIYKNAGGTLTVLGQSWTLTTGSTSTGTPTIAEYTFGGSNQLALPEFSSSDTGTVPCHTTFRLTDLEVQ